MEDVLGRSETHRSEVLEGARLDHVWVNKYQRLHQGLPTFSQSHSEGSTAAKLVNNGGGGA